MNITEYISSGVIELYVMGLCTDVEKKELEDLRVQYPELNKAIEEYEAELESKMQQDILLPPATTDERILAAITALNTPVIPITHHNISAKKITWLKPVAAAVFLILMISLVFNYALWQKNREHQAVITAGNRDAGLPLTDYQVLQNPSITPVAMYGVGIHAICRCTMFWDKKTGKMYVMIHHLVRSSENKNYQLWANVNNEMINIGMLDDSIRGRFVELQNVPSKATSFIVTLEKAGNITSPTLEETYLQGSI